MPAEDHLRVLDAVRRAGAVLVVDEALADLTLEGLEPLRTASLATGVSAGSLITIGSLSNTVWGGLRTGWVRADPSVIRRLADVRATADMGPPILGQLVARALLRDLDTIVAERRLLLRRQRDALVDAVDRLAGL